MPMLAHAALNTTRTLHVVSSECKRLSETVPTTSDMNILVLGTNNYMSRRDGCNDCWHVHFIFEHLSRKCRDEMIPTTTDMYISFLETKS